MYRKINAKNRESDLFIRQAKQGYLIGVHYLVNFANIIQITMATEIERKFLVDKKKWQIAEKPGGTLYRQGYLTNSAHPTIRVRVAGQNAYITLKGRNEGISRKEFEYQVPVAEAIEMLDNFALSEVDKVRYRIYHEGKLWEVDEFKGSNAGLILAEIELEQEDEAFSLPNWILEEVSGDVRYYNSNLSVKPYNSWKA